jgi:hypothetical protein
MVDGIKKGKLHQVKGKVKEETGKLTRWLLHPFGGKTMEIYFSYV